MAPDGNVAPDAGAVNATVGVLEAGLKANRQTSIPETFASGPAVTSIDPSLTVVSQGPNLYQLPALPLRKPESTIDPSSRTSKVALVLSSQTVR